MCALRIREMEFHRTRDGLIVFLGSWQNFVKDWDLNVAAQGFLTPNLNGCLTCFGISTMRPIDLPLSHSYWNANGREIKWMSSMILKNCW